MASGEKIFLCMEHADVIRDELRNRRVYVKHSLEGVNPFAIVGEKDGSMERYLLDCEDVPTIVSIKKNFAAMLERNADLYDNNCVKVPFGIEPEYYNTTDYLVICLSGLSRSLYRIGKFIYSDIDGQNEYKSFIKNGDKINFPFWKDFGWKYYTELLAEACINNYDEKKIILVRSNLPDWWIEDEEIHPFNSVGEIRKCVREIEDYYIELTHCRCANTFLVYAPIDGSGKMPSYSYEKLAEEIEQIVMVESQEEGDFCKFYPKLIDNVYRRLNLAKRGDLDQIIGNCDFKSSADVRRFFRKNHTTNKMCNDLKELLPFWEEGSMYNLSDYYKKIDIGALNYRLVELYVEYFQLDINDLLAFYEIYQHSSDKKGLSKCIQLICNNKNCYPLQAENNFVLSNMYWLQGYEYIDADFIDKFRLCSRYAFRISDNVCIEFLPGDTGAIRELHWMEKTPAYKKVVREGMTCRGNEFTSLTKSWSFYIERARRGYGNTPLKVVFNDAESFFNSCFFVDYRKLLESENAIIIKKDNIDKISTCMLKNYLCKCNFDFFFDRKTKIFKIQNGLADQVRYYIFSKINQESGDCLVLYDDLLMNKIDVFNGIEVEKITGENKEELASRLLSNRISKQLQSVFNPIYLQSNPYDPLYSLRDMLYMNGLTELKCATTINRIFRSFREGTDPDNFIIHINLKSILSCTSSSFKYYDIFPPLEIYLDEKVDFLSKYIKLPEFDDSENLAIEKEMLESDAVVIHVRCGDFLTVGRAPDVKFYYRCINNLEKNTFYRNKKYYVITDNYNWVKDHEDELGLSLVKEVRYITHNKGESSYKDLRLISQGKILVGGSSGFFRLGALMSARKEICLSSMEFLNKTLEKVGFKNKFDLRLRCQDYDFLGISCIDTNGWMKLEDSSVYLAANNNNFHFHRYNIPKGNGIYSIHIHGILATYPEFTAGLFDFVDNKIVQYETYFTSEDCWFNFSIGEVVEGLAFCFYAGITRRTAGNSLKVDNFTVKFKEK